MGARRFLRWRWSQPWTSCRLEVIRQIPAGWVNRVRQAASGGRRHTIDSVDRSMDWSPLAWCIRSGSSAIPAPVPATCWCSASRWASVSCRPPSEGQLDAAGYERLIASTTRLNTPGRALAELDAVHAMTDVRLRPCWATHPEMARGAGLRATLDFSAVPLLDASLNWRNRLHHRREPAQLDGCAEAARLDPG